MKLKKKHDRPLQRISSREMLQPTRTLIPQKPSMFDISHNALPLIPASLSVDKLNHGKYASGLIAGFHHLRRG